MYSLLSSGDVLYKNIVITYILNRKKCWSRVDGQLNIRCENQLSWNWSDKYANTEHDHSRTLEDRGWRMVTRFVLRSPSESEIKSGLHQHVQVPTERNDCQTWRRLPCDVTATWTPSQRPDIRLRVHILHSFYAVARYFMTIDHHHHPQSLFDFSKYYFGRSGIAPRASTKSRIWWRSCLIAETSGSNSNIEFYMKIVLEHQPPAQNPRCIT